jgi:ABC-2 type transport system ATP-binding protein
MICERVIIIHEGRIVAEDRIENLSSILAGSKRIRLEVQGPTKRIAKSLEQIEGVQEVRIEDSHFIIEYPPEQDPRAKIMEAIVQGGWVLLSMGAVEMSLEDIFLELTTEEEEEEEEDEEEAEE